MTTDSRHQVLQKQPLLVGPESIQQLQQLYQAHAASTSDLPPFDFDSSREFFINHLEVCILNESHLISQYHS
jgi:hypothetical protein